MVPTASERHRRLLPVVVAATVVLADQLTKWWALEALAGGRVINLVWTLRLNLTSNTGFAFSLGGGFGPLIAVVVIAVIGVLVWHGRTISSRTGAVAVGLLLGGALSNLGDRAFRGDGFLSGAVVDFIDLQWWPIFNLADAAVVIGVALFLVSSLRAAEP